MVAFAHRAPGSLAGGDHSCPMRENACLKVAEPPKNETQPWMARPHYRLSITVVCKTKTEPLLT